MKRKKCITLASQLAVFLLISASTIFGPYGVQKAEASNCSAKQAEHLMYAKSGSNTSDDGSRSVLGDVNSDGNINSLDFANMRMYLLGFPNTTITKDNISIADLNKDNLFNSVDLAIMRGYLLGIIHAFPGEAQSTPVPNPTPSPVSNSDDFPSSISKASYYVKVGEVVKGKIDFEGDKDYLLFKPSVDGRYRLDITTDPNSTRGYLYTLQIEGLDYYYNSFKTYSTSSGCYVEEYLVGNTEYYIGIKNVNGSTNLDSYTIKITKLN